MRSVLEMTDFTTDSHMNQHVTTRRKTSLLFNDWKRQIHKACLGQPVQSCWHVIMLLTYQYAQCVHTEGQIWSESGWRNRLLKRNIFIYFINLCGPGLPLSKGLFCLHPNWKEKKIITKTFKLSIRLMAYRHSLNTKYTKTATPARVPQQTMGAKIWQLASTLKMDHRSGAIKTQSLMIQWLGSDCESVFMLGWCSWHWRPCSRPEYRWGPPPLRWTPMGRSMHPVER